jgi:hypothetical protein
MLGYPYVPTRFHDTAAPWLWNLCLTLRVQQTPPWISGIGIHSVLAIEALQCRPFALLVFSGRTVNFLIA